MRRLRSFQESRKWYEQTMNIDNFEGRSVALGGEVWRTGARAGLGGIAGHDLGHISSPWVVPRSELLALPRRSETVLRALQKDLPGTILGAF